MSDEISLSKGWTLDAYVAHNEAMRVEAEKYMEEKFRAADKAVEAALTSAKEAVLKAEVASEKRFESINEFRATLSDQAQQFASQEKVNDLVSRFDRLEGRTTGLDAGWAKLLGAAVFAAAIVAIVAWLMK